MKYEYADFLFRDEIGGNIEIWVYLTDFGYTCVAYKKGEYWYFPLAIGTGSSREDAIKSAMLYIFKRCDKPYYTCALKWLIEHYGDVF